MRLNLDSHLIHRMAEGMVMLDHHGRVTGSNPKAEPWLALCRSQEKTFKRLISEELQGITRLPEPLDLRARQTAAPAAENASSMQAWLCKNGRREYVVLLIEAQRSAPAPHAPAPQVRDNWAPANLPAARDEPMVTLLSDAVRKEMGLLRALIRPLASKGPADTGCLLEQCAKVDKLLDQLSKLSELLQHKDVFITDRIALDSVMESCGEMLKAKCDRQGIALQLGSDSAAQVYGHSKWLSYALLVLLDALIQGAPRGGTVQLQNRQMGDFAVITGHVLAAKVLAAPPKVAENDRPSAEAAAALSGIPADAAIKMMLCKRIIELHAGTLKLEMLGGAQSADGMVESFTLTLHTGLPTHERANSACTTCRHVLQEEAYAHDFAQLIAQITPSRTTP